MSKTDSKKIGAVTWIAIQAEHTTTTGRAFADAAAGRIMSAALVTGKRAEEEWDALYAAAIEADATMADAANPDFGED